jgi:four helix bundle protein
MSNYRELNVWTSAMDLVEEIYLATNEFPKEEKFGLVSQMRRASVSIPSNIAEGSGRNSRGFFINFLNLAKGSTCELETQVLIAHRLGFLPENKMRELTHKSDQIQRMLYKLINSLK